MIVVDPETSVNQRHIVIHENVVTLDLHRHVQMYGSNVADVFSTTSYIRRYLKIRPNGLIQK